jgi:biotin transport system substrate-specific component
LVLATMLGAWICVPLPGSPVPLTLQTFFVLAGAGLFSGRLSMRAQLAYLVCGGIGLPFFAGGACGAPIFWGATGGYLIGFILASGLVGWLLPSAGAPSNRRLLAALVAGEFVILLSGVLWLAPALHLSWATAVKAGALVFLPGDALKLAAAAAVIRAYGARSRRLLAQ